MFFYQVIEEKLYTADIGAYISFGLKVIFATHGVYLELLRVSDISTDKSKVARLAALCTKGQVRPIHLADVIEDSLT